ncbi:hypothetical protein TNCV_4117861, partial [Trichonephila clavipes]
LQVQRSANSATSGLVANYACGFFRGVGLFRGVSKAVVWAIKTSGACSRRHLSRLHSA